MGSSPSALLMTTMVPFFSSHDVSIFTSPTLSSALATVVCTTRPSVPKSSDSSFGFCFSLKFALSHSRTLSNVSSKEKVPFFDDFWCFFLSFSDTDNAIFKVDLGARFPPEIPPVFFLDILASAFEKEPQAPLFLLVPPLLEFPPPPPPPPPPLPLSS